MNAPHKFSRQRHNDRMQRLGTALFLLTFASMAVVGCTNIDRRASIVPAAAEATTSEPTTTATITPMESESLVEDSAQASDTQIPVEVWNAVQLLDDLEQLPFADIYGGVEIGEDSSELVIYLTERSTRIEREVINFIAMSPDKVSFKNTSTTWRELLATNAKIQFDLGELVELFPINGVGIRMGMQVFISTTRPLDKSEKEELTDRYGDAINFDVEDQEFITSGSQQLEPEN